MVEEENSFCKNKKNLLFIIAAVILAGTSVAFVLWWFEVITFDSKARTVKTNPKNDRANTVNEHNGLGAETVPSISEKASAYDFEVNTGIKDSKAYVAYQSFLKLTEEEQKRIAPTLHNALINKPQNFDVIFTGTRNVGIVFFIAKMMTSDQFLFDSVFKIELEQNDSKKPTLKNLLIELAYQIRGRRKNGRIRLDVYDEYLYTIDRFAKEKDAVKSIADLKERAKMEFKLLNEQVEEENLSYVDELHFDTFYNENYIEQIMQEQEQLN